MITLRSVVFSYYIYDFRLSHSIADLLMAVTKRIARAFIISGATQAVAVDIPQGLIGFGMLGLFRNLNLVEFPVIVLALFLCFSVVHSFEIEWFWIGNPHRSPLLDVGILQDSTLGPVALLLYINASSWWCYLNIALFAYLWYYRLYFISYDWLLNLHMGQSIQE